MTLLLPLLLGAALAADPAPRRTSVPEAGSLECEVLDPCAEVLPGAVRFERPKGKPYAAGYDADGELVGWVVLSNDVTDIKGYSGKPLSTLVGLDTQGVISGGRVVHHAEPILLVGIPEQELHDFVGAYTGVHAEKPVVVGRSASPDQKAVDVVSGATVTVLAQNQTILAAARTLGADVGVIARPEIRPGRFVEDAPWSWERMMSEEALGHLRLSAEQMGAPPADQPFVDLYFGMVDAPQLGIPLLGELRWRKAMEALEEGEHLFVVFNAGSWSYKGSGFVRGGIFDRFRLEQGLSVQTFRDMDYTNLDPPALDGTPAFWEAGLFVLRAGTIDPGRTYDFVFVGSLYDGKGGFSREFRSFDQPFREPASVYVAEGPDPEAWAWTEAWKVAPWRTGVVAAWLTFVVGLFSVGRKALTAKMSRLKWIHVAVMSVSALGLGFGLKFQPSITQLLTLVGSVVGEWRWSLFLSDPVIFLGWIFIALVTLIWGRGVFCGWVCPFGTLNELVFKAARAVGLREYILPQAIHDKAKYLRYVVLASLVVTFLWDAETGEKMAEVEPFKSTFFVPIWTREAVLIAWWSLLMVGAVFVYRPFCQYVCPLGAGLALPSHFRLSPPYRRDFCSKCKICTRGCEPRAIGPTGVIDGKDCLSCMECEANWGDDQVCPPLVKERRVREKLLSAGAASLKAD